MTAETPSTPARKRAPAKRSAASAPGDGGTAVLTADKQVVVIPAQAGPVDNQLVPAPPAPVTALEQPQSVVPVQVNVQVAAPAAPQVVISVKQRGLFVRALYYVFIGWWLSGLMMFAAGLCIGSVVLLPAGLAMVNRLPQVMTLRPRSIALNAAMLADGSMQYTLGSARQRSMLVRTV